MKKLIVFTVSFLLVLCTASFSEAILIGSANTTHSGGSEGVFSSIDLDAKYSYTTLDPVIFDSLIVSTTDIGTEFFATSSTGFSPDPGFDDFASNITDGIDQLLSFGLTGNYESLLFSTSPDFQDYTIDAFGLKINDISFDSPGTDPNRNGNWTDFNWNLTLNVYGNPVPEPTTMLLFGAGLVGLAGFGRKKFKN